MKTKAKQSKTNQNHTLVSLCLPLIFCASFVSHCFAHFCVLDLSELHSYLPNLSVSLSDLWVFLLFLQPSSGIVYFHFTFQSLLLPFLSPKSVISLLPSFSCVSASILFLLFIFFCHYLPLLNSWSPFLLISGSLSLLPGLPLPLLPLPPFRLCTVCKAKGGRGEA